MSKWIYAIRDTGYENGIKVGRASDKSRFLGKPPGHSPRPLEIVGAWEFDAVTWRSVARHTIAGSNASDSAIEAWFRDLEGVDEITSSHSFNGQTYCGGTEFLNISATDFLRCFAERLDKAGLGHIARCHAGIITPKGDFMRSGNRKTPIFSGKQVLWVWQEIDTGRLKTQRTSEWSGPIQETWTYSRNGVYPVGAFTYGPDSVSSDAQDIEVERLWQTAIAHFGEKNERKCLGWTVPGTTLGDLREFYLDAGLTSLDRYWLKSHRITGVREKYNDGSKQRAMNLPITIDCFGV